MWEEKFNIGIFTWPRITILFVFTILNALALIGKDLPPSQLGWAFYLLIGAIIVCLFFYVSCYAALAFVRGYHENIRDPLEGHPTDGFRDFDYIIALTPKVITGSFVEIHAEIISLLLCTVLQIGFLGILLFY